MNSEFQTEIGNKLVKYGILLLLLGLVTGLAIPALENPRMGLSSHLEGTFNGMLLILFGAIWQKLRLSERTQKWSFGLALFGTYINWATTFLAALWGAGSEMMPFAGGDFVGSAWQEGLIKFGLVSLSVAMIAVSIILLFGMRKEKESIKAAKV